MLICETDGVSECTVNGIAVQRVERRMVDGAEESNYTWCNTNNHRDTEAYIRLQGTGENWYSTILEETRMQKWAEALGSLCGDRLIGGRLVTITAEQQRKYFKPASQLAMVGARAASLFGEEAEDLAAELAASSAVSLDPPAEGWFVRTTACSPKDSCHDGGGGPHHSLTKVVLALLASERIQRSMRNYETDQLVYLMPFDRSVSTERELRVFVHNRVVTAISQYDPINPSSVFAYMSDLQLAKVAENIVEFHRESLSPAWESAGGISSYVMDVEFVIDNGVPQIRLMELNCFGAEMAAASALFHWVRDERELMSPDRLCIRVLSEV